MSESLEALQKERDSLKEQRDDLAAEVESLKGKALTLRQLLDGERVRLDNVAKLAQSWRSEAGEESQKKRRVTSAAAQKRGCAEELEAALKAVS